MTIDHRLKTLEAEMDRIVALQEQTREEIKQLVVSLGATQLKLQELLTHDAELTELFQFKRAAITRLKIDKVKIH
ncbi:hypothetical protein [Brevibacillus laterosporus]|uniref:Uncharacterized protein n=1 Tax=Brevibacillus laterosporus TaxID=1465 RepID=A0AAP3DD32_BRELA|nr:hypothetical protein [Brevibacillus laterosporus]MCR8978725.1 hypothetical protein [Brevibacillus laterosporus]MCZ0805881.1 hypothetical protein [Brevibacillus laterosporus]MCZ0824353.1 hypothetical protein [Brevibacillus laterosporus]MCZ0848257.1 hypothetical protein [Brevibacillus laterosporus]